MEHARRGVGSLGRSKLVRTVVCLLAAAGCFAVALSQYEVYAQPSTRYCTSPVLSAPFPCDIGAVGVAFIFALAALALLAMGVRGALRNMRGSGRIRSGGDWA